MKKDLQSSYNRRCSDLYGCRDLDPLLMYLLTKQVLRDYPSLVSYVPVRARTLRSDAWLLLSSR